MQLLLSFEKKTFGERKKHCTFVVYLIFNSIDMKRNLLLVIVSLFFGVVNAQAVIPEKSVEKTVVFEDLTHDFGSIESGGGTVEYSFVFENAGSGPIIIEGVRTSCGCTVSKWTKEPVESGKKGSIKVSFNPAGRQGSFSKTITVSSNGNPSRIVLTIKGNIK